MAGLVNSPNMGVYNVSKAAVVALTETLFHDLALVTDQIHASVLCPSSCPPASARATATALATCRTASPRAASSCSRSCPRRPCPGKVSATEVARMVFDAVDQQRFYAHSHPQALRSVRARLDDIVGGRNPTSPFADKPELGEQLKAQLRR